MRAFLFYIDDWLSSKKIEFMDAHEERGYLRLLIRAATEPDCGLPNDDEQLAILSLLGRQWFKPTKERQFRLGEKTSGQKLKECFFEQNGRLYNERLLKEFNHQNEVREKRAAAGSKGGNSKANAVAIAKQMGKQKPTNDVCVYGLSSSSKEQETSEETVGKSAIPIMDPHPIHNSDWFDFRSMAESVGMFGSEPDWSNAFRWYWRNMSLEMRRDAFRGLKARAGTDDPAIRSLPQNYLKEEKWARPIRSPTTLSANSVSAKDAKVLEILERKERERSERGSQQSV